MHRILDPNLALGMSTTGLDPSADELEILRKISANFGVDTQSLRSRTRIITGGRETPIRRKAGISTGGSWKPKMSICC